jgi:hypothetical protein
MKIPATIETKSAAYLKGKNVANLWAFTAVNIAVFLSLLAMKSFSVGSVEEFWSRVGAKNGLIAAIVPILTVVLNSVLSSSAKARIVFWRWSFPLPGCRVFTDLVHTDHRIDTDSLARELGPLPTEPHEQNVLWYRTYKRHAAMPVIAESQKVYLLTRDMTAIAFAFLLLFPIGALAGSVDGTTVGIYAAGLLIQYIILANSARNTGNRFALNVLAEESNRIPS